jgi:hypothetical protein
MVKQQSVDRHVDPPRHIILILSKPVFVHTPKFCVLNRETANTNFIVFRLIPLELESTIYRT